MWPGDDRHLVTQLERILVEPPPPHHGQRGHLDFELLDFTGLVCHVEEQHGVRALQYVARNDARYLSLPSRIIRGSKRMMPEGDTRCAKGQWEQSESFRVHVNSSDAANPRRLGRPLQVGGVERLEAVDRLKRFAVDVPLELPQHHPVGKKIDQRETVLLDRHHRLLYIEVL